MPQGVIAGVNQAATLAGLTDEERKPVDKCVSYLKANIGAIRYREFLQAMALPLLRPSSRAPAAT